MRIISGQYRGRVLKSPPNIKTRPTSDRLRETLFNILNSSIAESARILDLCAGTGAVGIEAISRGAAFAVFVDKSRKACGLIESNLDLLEIPESQTEVVCSSAEDFLRRYSGELFDIVFFDPPYKNEYEDVLRLVSKDDSKILNQNGIFIAEHHSKIILPDLFNNLRRWRLLKQGDSSLSFYETK